MKKQSMQSCDVHYYFLSHSVGKYLLHSIEMFIIVAASKRWLRLSEGEEEGGGGSKFD